jgi:hypothetical protein
MLKLYKSGKHVDPLNLRPMDLDIRDIAHNLSLLCRYTGAFPFHYSVAQHSLLVCQMMKEAGRSETAQLAGLLHDSAEYVFGDVNYHLKRLPELAEYNRREHLASEMIVAHFGADPGLLTTVKDFDRAAAHLEMSVRDGKSFEIVEHNSKTIYHRFLLKFGELTGDDPYDHSSFHLPSNL